MPGAPVRTQCTTSVNARTLLLPPRALHELQLRLRAEQPTEQWRIANNRPAGIEGCISEAVRGYGMRHCHYRGLAKTGVQHVLIACALNASRLADWYQRGQNPAPARPPSKIKTLSARLTPS